MFKQPNLLKLLAGTVVFGILSTTLHAKIEKELSYAATLSEGDTVAFNGDISDIKLVKTDGNEVRYDVKLVYKSDDKAKAEKMFDKVTWTFDDEGPYIELKEKVKKAKKLDITVTLYLPDSHPMDLSTCSGDISTQDDFASNMKLNVVSGDAALQSVQGNVRISSVSGDLTAKTIGGNVSLNTVSGDVEIETVNGSVNGDSVSGDVSIESISSEVNCESVSGDLSIGLTADNAGPISIDTVSGDVSVKCPAETGLKLNVGTVSGDISCDHSLSEFHGKNKSLKGYFGDGKTDCTIGTVSGDIQIKN